MADNGPLWPASLEFDRVRAVAAVDVASSHVSAALGDPARCHEASVRSRVAFRAALRFMAQAVACYPRGRRWAGRLKVARDMVEQYAGAGVAAVDVLDNCGDTDRRRLLLVVLGLLADLGYYLEVFGPAAAGLHVTQGDQYG